MLLPGAVVLLNKKKSVAQSLASMSARFSLQRFFYYNCMLYCSCVRILVESSSAEEVLSH